MPVHGNFMDEIKTDTWHIMIGLEPHKFPSIEIRDVVGGIEVKQFFT